MITGWSEVDWDKYVLNQRSFDFDFSGIQVQLPALFHPKFFAPKLCHVLLENWSLVQVVSKGAFGPATTTRSPVRVSGSDSLYPPSPSQLLLPALSLEPLPQEPSPFSLSQQGSFVRRALGPSDVSPGRFMDIPSAVSGAYPTADPLSEASPPSSFAREHFSRPVPEPLDSAPLDSYKATPDDRARLLRFKQSGNFAGAVDFAAAVVASGDFPPGLTHEKAKNFFNNSNRAKVRK